MPPRPSGRRIRQWLTCLHQRYSVISRRRFSVNSPGAAISQTGDPRRGRRWPLFRYGCALGSRRDLMIRATACTFLLSVSLAAATVEAGQPDLILVGAKVLTSDPRQPTAEAIALEGERIRSVGRNDDVRRLGGPQ